MIKHCTKTTKIKKHCTKNTKMNQYGTSSLHCIKKNHFSNETTAIKNLDLFLETILTYIP